MSIYLTQISQLIALQKVDDEIYVIEQDMDFAPKELEELQLRFDAITARRLRQNEKMEHLAEQKKRLGVEIEDDSARIRKSKNKLMQVANTKEYHAMVREMDSLEKVNRDREEEKTTLIEELTLQQQTQDEIEKEFVASDSELKACEANLQERLDKGKKQLEGLTKKHDSVAKDVPAPILSRYDFIRVRLAHPVIVPIVESICTGCHISIPPQAYIELQKGSQILSCPNCQRLIFWENHFIVPTEEVDKAEAEEKAPAEKKAVAKKAPAEKKAVAKKAPAEKKAVAKKAPAEKKAVAKKETKAKKTVEVEEK